MPSWVLPAVAAELWGVSIEHARGFRLNTQWLYIGYIASSTGVFGPRAGLARYRAFIARTLSR